MPKILKIIIVPQNRLVVIPPVADFSNQIWAMFFKKLLVFLPLACFEPFKLLEFGSKLLFVHIFTISDNFPMSRDIFR